MFDIATRPQPLASVRLGIAFDWQLASPKAAGDYPWTDYSAPSGEPQLYVDQLATYALELEPTLNTAITISLFTDARAGADDVLPRGATHRRGWVGSEFLGEDDPWGSGLWLLYFGKSQGDILARAKFTVVESLSWLIRAGIASRVEAEAEWVAGTQGERLAVRPKVYQPDRVSPVYDVLWGTTLMRGASQ